MFNFEFIEYLMERLPYSNEVLTIMLGDCIIKKDGVMTIYFLVSKRGFQTIKFYRPIPQERFEKMGYEEIFNELIESLISEYLRNTENIDKFIKSVMGLFKKYEIELTEFTSFSCTQLRFEFNIGKEQKSFVIEKFSNSMYFFGINSLKYSKIYNNDEILSSIEECLKELINKEKRK